MIIENKISSCDTKNLKAHVNITHETTNVRYSSEDPNESLGLYHHHHLYYFPFFCLADK